MTIREYLFIDEGRLASYVEQIGSPVTYDTVPVWTAEISFLGLKASGRQERHARELSRSEKIEILVAHLREHKLLADRRPGEWSTPVFVIERFAATKVMLAPSTKQKSLHPGLTLWISEAPDDPDANPDAGLLCLLQDSVRDDIPRAENGLMAASSYSVLVSLLRDIGERLHLTVLGDAFMTAGAVWGDKELLRQFVRDPIAKLRSLGCLAGPKRTIKALYRVREFAQEFGDEEGRTSTFGYPIYIAEARTNA